MYFDYIRSYYRVPAKRGGRIRFRGEPGTITGTTDGGRLIVRPDVRKYKSTRWILHPTWQVEYLEEGKGR